MVLRFTQPNIRRSAEQTIGWSHRRHPLPRLALCFLMLLEVGCGSIHLNNTGSTEASTASLALTPAAATLSPSASLQMAVSVTGSSNQTFTWSVNNIPGGNATIGEISGTGVYVAPSVPPPGKTVSIQVASAANPSLSASAQLTISDLVTVAPSSASLAIGDALQFSASINQSPSLAVTWEINGIPGGNAALGTISATGLYQAPAILQTPAITVSAVESGDSDALGTATMTLYDPAILAAHNAWLAGVAQAAAVDGCTNISVQQQESESLADAIARFTLTGSEGSCLVLWPVSTDANQVRYSFSWGGTTDGKDILYLSDVSQPRIWNAAPVASVSAATSVLP